MTLVLLGQCGHEMYRLETGRDAMIEFVASGKHHCSNCMIKKGLYPKGGRT